MSVQLLGEKMKELENALFVSETNALAKLPTHIVQIVEVDESGNAWFIIPRPTQVIEAFGSEMPSKLDLFKKGKGFYLKIRGAASLIQAEEDLPKTNIFQELSGSFKKKEVVAVKLKMQSVEYFDSSPKTVPNPVRNIGSIVYNWLMDPLFNAKQPQLVTIPVYAENS